MIIFIRTWFYLGMITLLHYSYIQPSMQINDFTAPSAFLPYVLIHVHADQSMHRGKIQTELIPQSSTRRHWCNIYISSPSITKAGNGGPKEPGDFRSYCRFHSSTWLCQCILKANTSRHTGVMPGVSWLASRELAHGQARSFVNRKNKEHVQENLFGK